MRKLILVLFICIAWIPLSDGQIRLQNDTTIFFATVDEGRRVLMKRDDFVQRMSPFDRAARMKTNHEVSEETYLLFAGKNVMNFNKREKNKVRAALKEIKPPLNAYDLNFPKHILIIKTTGKEEGNAAYTRSNAIILPEKEFNLPKKKIKKLISHELFHILTRNNPELKERLYETIGFKRCDEVVFPDDIRLRKVTNPDAPKNDHAIQLRVNGKAEWAVPVLFSTEATYDVKRGGEFFKYMEFQFLLIDLTEGKKSTVPQSRVKRRVWMKEVSGFFEQVGRNTNYIIHPEEILADNFALLLVPEKIIASPEILEKISTALKAK